MYIILAFNYVDFVFDTYTYVHIEFTKADENLSTLCF